MPRSKKTTEPSFESALGELEAMVETMESGELPLEDLITHYERGAQLITRCETVLNDARKRLDLITLKPTSADDQNESVPPTTPATNDHNDDEIRLF